MLYAQGLVRSEAVLSAAVLLAAPLFLRSWAKMEAEYHDTLECRTVLQTYLIAAGGSLCSVFAAIAGNPVVAVLLQVLWLAAFKIYNIVWTVLGRCARCAVSRYKGSFVAEAQLTGRYTRQSR